MLKEQGDYSNVTRKASAGGSARFGPREPDGSTAASSASAFLATRAQENGDQCMGFAVEMAPIMDASRVVSPGNELESVGAPATEGGKGTAAEDGNGENGGGSGGAWSGFLSLFNTNWGMRPKPSTSVSSDKKPVVSDDVDDGENCDLADEEGELVNACEPSALVLRNSVAESYCVDDDSSFV